MPTRVAVGAGRGDRIVATAHTVPNRPQPLRRGDRKRSIAVDEGGVWLVCKVPSGAWGSKSGDLNQSHQRLPSVTACTAE